MVILALGRDNSSLGFDNLAEGDRDMMQDGDGDIVNWEYSEGAHEA